ncbi:hydroxycinnamoyltransferase-like [Panicum virgatum]|uniref:hydroxycinnamoyltransferase-like n=1 Tax=Panicum virgatum TaxID=38727 RepID=UPI0019D68858|nr:hydroxycinnamoyltransferase-like [Panicum virgatum]
MPAERVDVAILSWTLVRASDPPRGFPAVLPVSNLDLILGSFHIHLVFIYPAPAAGFPAVTAPARAALIAFLSRFFPFAVRVVADASTGVLAVACDNAGVELVVAEAAARLADVAFADADRSLARLAVPFQDGLALSLQLVWFACGGFALSWGTDHLLADGHGLTALPNTWAELLRTGGLSWEPHHERASLFRPRSPPRFSPSVDAEFTRYALAGLPNALLTATLVCRNYVVSAADVARLRAAASTPARRATRLEAPSGGSPSTWWRRTLTKSTSSCTPPTITPRRGTTCLQACSPTRRRSTSRSYASASRALASRDLLLLHITNCTDLAPPPLGVAFPLLANLARAAAWRGLQMQIFFPPSTPTYLISYPNPSQPFDI